MNLSNEERRFVNRVLFEVENQGTDPVKAEGVLRDKMDLMFEDFGTPVEPLDVDLDDPSVEDLKSLQVYLGITTLALLDNMDLEDMEYYHELINGIHAEMVNAYKEKKDKA